MKNTIFNITCIMTILIFTQSNFAVAQVAELKTGDRVRIETTDRAEPVVGSITLISPGLFRIKTKKSEEVILMNRIKNMDLSIRPKKSGWKGALYGGVGAGVVSGLIAHAVLPKHATPPPPCEQLICIRKANNELLKKHAPLVGFGIGVYGALFGWLIDRKKEKWENIPMDISMTSAPASLSNQPFTPMLSLKFNLGKKK